MLFARKIQQTTISSTQADFHEFNEEERLEPIKKMVVVKVLINLHFFKNVLVTFKYYRSN